MLSRECLGELRSAWLPNISDTGLDRLVEMLDRGSPLLISGCFTRAIPMGCLASHIAWNHPTTGHLTVDAGITWLHRIAGLNPATSHVLQEWDRRCPQEWVFRGELLRLFREERDARAGRRPAAPARPAVVV